jgi:hypothetical protein
MLYSFTSFPGLDAADFDAFAPKKWSSNRFNLERMKTRAKLESLGRELERRAADRVGDLVFTTTMDHPHIFNKNQVAYMWLYLDRPAEERDQLARVIDKQTSVQQKVTETIAQHQVALVGVGLDNDSFSIFLRLHAKATLDRQNLMARLSDPADAQQFAILLARLGEGFTLTADGQEVSLPTSAGQIPEFVKALEKLQGWCALEKRFARDSEHLTAERLPDDVAPSLLKLLDLWRFGAWSRDNDRLKLAKVLKEEKKQKAKRLSGFSEGDSVRVVSGLLSGKEGTVVSVDLKGRVKVQFGRLNMEMEGKLLRRI